jgi:hypothetical protein
MRLSGLCKGPRTSRQGDDAIRDEWQVRGLVNFVCFAFREPRKGRQPQGGACTLLWVSRGSPCTVKLVDRHASVYSEWEPTEGNGTGPVHVTHVTLVTRVAGGG